MKLELTETQAQAQLGAHDAAVRMIAQSLQQIGLNGAAQAIKSLKEIIELSDIIQAAIDAAKEKAE
jgi:hypothetical protein